MFNQDDLGEGLTPLERQFVLQLEIESQLTPQDAECSTTADNESGYNAKEIQSQLFKYLDHITQNQIKIIDDDFDWLNVSRPLSLISDLNGMIVLYDFFTYCCINCLHILPFLKKIEDEYKSEELLVVGIHSPKFENEKSLKNLADAIARHQITHPVCNDPKLKLWKHLNINCWPTLIIAGPNGEILFTLIGEKSIESKTKIYVDSCLNYFKLLSQLNPNKKASLPVEVSQHSLKTELCFPTKIAISPSNEKIAVANSLKHSIIIFNCDGSLHQIIGSNAKVGSHGFNDGNFDDALFNYPQGLSWINEDTLVVCDTENNALRKLCFKAKLVETIVANSVINSPWDCTFDSTTKILYIAMAGSHQIWVLILSEKPVEIHGREYSYGECACFAGDGLEQNRNSRNLLKSSFAQPSGICLMSDKLFIADSESSSVRIVDLSSNSVSILAGANSNPLDLFAYGDSDGVGMKCKLQHCMGVYGDQQNNVIFIADTFNHKIKTICVQTRTCETFNFYWDDNEDIKSLNEPNGLSICMIMQNGIRTKCLLIADTNNHRIVAVDLSNNKASTLKFTTKMKYLTYDLNEIEDEVDYSTLKRYFEKQECLSTSEELQIRFDFCFESDFKVQYGAKHNIKMFTKNKSINQQNITTKDLKDLQFTIKCPSSKIDLEDILLFECSISLCNSKQNFCTLSKILIEQPVFFSSNVFPKSGSDRKVKYLKVKM